MNAEGKDEVEMQTPIDDSGIFTEVSRSAQAFPSPCWSPSQGIPRKGQAPGRVTPWIALSLSHAQVGLWCAFRQASPGPLPAIFTIKLLAKTLRGLVLFSTRWWPHHKRGWCGLARLQALSSTNMVHTSTLGFEVCKPH